MIRVPVTRVLDTDVAELVRHAPPDLPPLAIPPGEPYSIYDTETGVTIAIVARVPADLTHAAAAAFTAMPPRTVVRSAGIRTRSQVFGWAAPNNVLQRPAPAFTAWMRDAPDGHRVFDRLADHAWAELRAEGSPEVLGLMESIRDRIHPDYRLGDSPWTSGIANNTVNLQYHHDRNNVAHSWSAMLCARAGTGGGNLHVADYGAVLPIRDRDLLMFPGVDWVHGVTPIHKRQKAGFRYTFVMYSVNAFVGMPEPAEARAATARRRTELEDTLLDRQRQIGYMT